MVEPNRHSVRTYICSWYVILTRATMSHVRNKNHAPVCDYIEERGTYSSVQDRPHMMFCSKLTLNKEYQSCWGKFLEVCTSKNYVVYIKTDAK